MPFVLGKVIGRENALERIRGIIVKTNIFLTNQWLHSQHLKQVTLDAIPPLASEYLRQTLTHLSFYLNKNYNEQSVFLDVEQSPNME
jgi:hypothetical protein